MLILMGDLADGQQKKSDGTGTTTGHLGAQVDMAIKCLRPLAKRAKTIIRVDGTPYHEGFHGAMAKLDVELGVNDAKQVIDIDMGCGIMNVAHHPSGGSALYAGTKVDRDSLWSMIAAHEGHIPDARWIIRAHIHHYMKQETRLRTMIQTPCFQLQTPHAKKNNLYRWQPSLGGLLMLADDRADDGYIFVRTLYETPKPEVIPYGSLKARRASTVGD